MTAISMTSSLSVNITLMDNFNNSVDQLISGVEQLNKSFTRVEETLKEMCGIQSQILNKESNTINIISREISLTNVLNQSIQNTVNVQKNMSAGAEEHGSIMGKVFGVIKSGIQKTIEEAVKMQNQMISVQGMLGNKEAGRGYFDHLQKQANESGFAFEDLQNNARNFLGITKNTDSLDKLTNLSERLSIGNTSKGLEDAGSAIKDMMSGEGDSLKDDFGFNDDDIGILKASKNMDDFTSKFDNLLNKKGLNSDMLDTFNNSATSQFDNLKSNISTGMGDAGRGALEALTRIMSRVNQMFSNGSFQIFFNGLSKGLVWIASLIVSLVNWIMWVGNIFQSNWSIIAPIIWGIIGAFLIYNTSLVITNALNSEGAIAMAAKTIADWAETAAIIAMTIAQDGLNAALAMCPITWIIIAIIALIAIFYVAVAAINEFAGTGYSATGLIAGLFGALGALIYNSIAYSWNAVAAFVEFIANVFANPVYSVKKLFVNLATNVLDMCISMTSGFDKFATNMANAIIDGVNGAIKGLNWFIEKCNNVLGTDFKAFGTIEHTESITSSMQGVKDGLQNSLGDAPSDYRTVPRMEMKSVGGAYDWMYSKGAGLESSIGNMFNNKNNSIPDLSSWNKSQGPGTLSFGNNDNSDLNNNVAQGTESLNNIDNSIDISNEHLELLRDLAEQDSIQNFVSLSPTVQITTGDIKEEADINKIISHIENYMETELANSAEGLYA
jgi:hypothetical protein